ncbi:MAG TPA: endonuclease/exonuclease/phosphatase family protein [Blastocatellia bacterium]|nr:endonuclease/exonuclease/phosphatase family protein [Blastocatellia bacterium]
MKIATYNIHKCVGIDRRRSIERIARVIAEIDPDVIALQEVVSDQGSDHDQAHELAYRLGMIALLGPAIEGHDFKYGNVILSRIPVESHENFNLTFAHREPRAIHRVDIAFDAGLLHFYNTHLGTSYRERSEQTRRLVESEILRASRPGHPQVLVGDFNDWFPGRASRLLGDHLQEATRRIRPTYPVGVPLLKLDRIYTNAHVRCRRVWAHTTRLARVASDHVPIVALIESTGGETSSHGAD